MNTFVNAIGNQEARTDNGMKARKSTSSSCVDLFFKAGAMRGQDITPVFAAAYAENPDYALRIALWLRDIRSGAGERKLYRDILLKVEQYNTEYAKDLIWKTAELGRWDDLLVEWQTAECREHAFNMIKEALKQGHGLAAKWMPRKDKKAVELRKYFGWTPKFYRKRLVELTKVVETQMCNNDWDNIDFNKVPSLALARSKKAFKRHTEKFAQWSAKLVSVDPEVKATVKVNAGAVYPYDVLKNFGAYQKAELDAVQGQWEALPNYLGDASIMPIVDTSGSMDWFKVGSGKSMLSPRNVAMSLGLYVADKSKGPFKDVMLSFSGDSEINHLKGNIIQKMDQVSRLSVGGNTNLHKAFEKILQLATKNNVPESDMPQMLLIMSDMQFDLCATYDDSAIEMIRRKYEAAGYKMPQVVFWNLNAGDNVPVSSNDKGVALVSGFSPAIIKPLLSCQLEKFTPEGIMLETIMKDRYDY